jgi:hypothetical protein
MTAPEKSTVAASHTVIVSGLNEEGNPDMFEFYLDNDMVRMDTSGVHVTLKVLCQAVLLLQNFSYAEHVTTASQEDV